MDPRPTSPPLKETRPKKHTAVIYFHGMGDQKRYEEVSRLIDALDRYDYESKNKGFRGIDADLEPPNSDLTREVGYIDSVFIQRKETEITRSVFRFYEAYWANLTAGGVGPREVLTWILKQSIIPLKLLLLPWRDMQRVKRAVLTENWNKIQSQRKDIQDNDLKYLLTIYDEFESWPARRQYPQGRMRQFIEFISQRKEDAARRERLSWIARKWQRHFLTSNLFTFLTIITFLLAAGLILLGLFAIISFVLKEATSFTPTWVTSLLGEEALNPASTANILLAISAVLAATRIPYFLSEYMGDVYFWTTYEETAEKHQKRRAILDHCANVVEHVLRTDCDRIIIVAHSLGSTIAFDTILELERRNRAAAKSTSAATSKISLEKIQHFITMGSPIDKIHYFFENQTSSYHRYNRVVEDIRGDISKPPFINRRKPQIHWINFWDKADIISGSLQTPEGRKQPEIRVDNYEVSSFHFPFPGEAHLAYFENKEVIETIYRAIFLNDYNLASVSSQRGKKNYAARLVGPGKGVKVTQLVQALILFLPWLITAYLAVRALELPTLEPLLRFINYGYAALIAVWGVIGKVKGQINRLIPTSVKQMSS
ncbi:MAG: hypothetical protein IH588_11585 [Anaerolineales bacterium]|nr:hypothetical protein [Anaerolineales bacterium]